MEKKIKKSSIVKTFVDFYFFAQSCYNYERLQAISFAQSMYHVLKDLYDTPEEIGRELSKHTSFFNTETDIGLVIHGIVSAMEEERANSGGDSSEITAEAIVAVKTGLMGPFAGIGDSLFQGVISPLLLSIFVAVALEGNLFAPILFIAISVAIFVGVAYSSIIYGYKMGAGAIDKLTGSNMINNILVGAGIVGCMAMGALVANHVQLYTPISVMLSKASETNEPSMFYIQTQFFDAILKGLLPLSVSLIIWYLLAKKKMSVINIIGIVAVVAFVLGALGIISNVSPV